MVRNTRVALAVPQKSSSILPLRVIVNWGWLALGLVMVGFIGCAPSSNSSDSDVSTLAKNDSKSSDSKKPTAPEPPKFDSSINLEALLAARLPEEDLDNGWIRLFDTYSLTGWSATSKANWSVEDKTISVSEGDAGFLVTTSRFGDFELQLEYYAPASTNSGVFLRTLSTPKEVDRDCFELNIAPVDNPFPTGSLVGRARVESEAIGPLDEMEWHSVHALCDGKHIQTWIDGKIAADYQDTSDLKSGLIGLQFREGAIKFRDVRIRPISYTVLPAENLEGWQANPKDISKEVPEADPAKDPVEPPKDAMTATRTDDGGIKIQGGKGCMELLQSLGDFSLQAKVLVDSSAVNSGIFFRCIPGQEMNGYECQVHHGFIDDRRLPKDAGMGAIFRRQSARAVLSDAGKPTRLTIIADGPHIATWVEGVQVVDWTDNRQPNENPREGFRKDPGTIQFQGHDPSTEAVFQSLKISPIP